MLMLKNLLTYVFVSGLSFLFGIFLILAATAVFLLVRKNSLRRWSYHLGSLGIIMIIASTTPLPDWLYAVWGLSILSFVLSLRLGRRSFQTGAAASIAIISILAAILEFPYIVSPRIPSPITQFYLIGDSISAGIGQEKLTWDELLRDQHSVKVISLARGGAKAGSAMTQAERLKSPDVPVLMEIGGNDLLQFTPPSEFEKDLETLIRVAKSSGRTVIMLELPLFPSRMAYGRIQRRLAQDYHVILVPKRLFAWVLLAPRGTVDGLHLSDLGHQRMADMIWGVIANSHQ